MTLIPIPPRADQTIVKSNRVPTQQFRLFLMQIAALFMLSGTGSPEGVVPARAKKLYMDETGLPGNILYIKRINAVGGDKTLGWVLV